MTPIMMIGRKEVAAAEALVTWQNPKETHPNFGDDLGGLLGLLLTGHESLLKEIRVILYAKDDRFLRDSAGRRASDRGYIGHRVRRNHACIATPG